MSGSHVNSPKVNKQKSISEKMIGNTTKVNVATGGGEPIKAGHKMTDEKRVLQPRKSNGQFEFNSAKGWSTKYPQHSERNGLHGTKEDRDKNPNLFRKDRDLTVPEFAHGLKEAFAEVKGDIIPAGSTISINGTKALLAVKMTKEEFKDMIRNGGKNGEGKYEFKGATGMVSKVGEHKGKEGDKAEVKISNGEGLRLTTKLRMMTAARQYERIGHGQNLDIVEPDEAPGLSDEQKQKNKDWNDAKDTYKPQQPQSQSTTPEQPQSQSTTPEQPQNQPQQGGGFKPSKDEAKANPSEYLKKHKDYFDRVAKGLSEKMGRDITAQEVFDKWKSKW